MHEPFETIHHVCIVVPDIDSAIRFYTAIGIEPWHEYPPLTEYSELVVPSEQAFMNLRYVYALRGSCQIQLVQPGAGASPQRQFLEKTGGGVFHIGFDVEDIGQSVGRAASLGITPWMTGRRPDGSGFTYFNTVEDAGVTLEIRQGVRLKPE